MVQDTLFDILNGQKSLSVLDEASQERYIDAYKKQPVPNKKMEQWRYYNPEPLFEKQYVNNSPAKFEGELPQKSLIVDSYKICFVNGVFSELLSNFACFDINVKTLQEQLNDNKNEFDKYFDATKISEQGKFQMLNTCFAQNGIFIFINKPLSQPIEIIYLNSENSQSIAQTRVIIVARPHCEAKIVESHFSSVENKLFQNIATELILEENASIHYTILQNEGQDSIQINNLNVLQSAHSKFMSNTLTLNGGVVRNNIVVNHTGEYCETTLNGIFFPSEKQHLENITVVNHNMPHCTTNELYRGIAKDEATGVFVGIINVARDAQKTLANQSNKNIVLSDKASIFSKPQLEIFADDVSCSHGSTTGQLDREALFYCQARGIEYDRAVKLLLDAFFADVTQNLPFEELYSFVEAVIKTKI